MHRRPPQLHDPPPPPPDRQQGASYEIKNGSVPYTEGHPSCITTPNRQQGAVSQNTAETAGLDLGEAERATKTEKVRTCTANLNSLSLQLYVLSMLVWVVCVCVFFLLLHLFKKHASLHHSVYIHFFFFSHNTFLFSLKGFTHIHNRTHQLQVHILIHSVLFSVHTCVCVFAHVLEFSVTQIHHKICIY